MSKFDLIAFDADDTLWHNERLYVDAQSRFVELLAHYHDPDWIRERLKPPGCTKWPSRRPANPVFARWKTWGSCRACSKKRTAGIWRF